MPLLNYPWYLSGKQGPRQLARRRGSVVTSDVTHLKRLGKFMMRRPWFQGLSLLLLRTFSGNAVESHYKTSLIHFIFERAAATSINMCLECLIRIDSRSAAIAAASRDFSAISKEEAMEFAPVGTYPPTDIDVLIVGTGFGGLTAALEFTRKGHTVRIVERHGSPDVSGKPLS